MQESKSSSGYKNEQGSENDLSEVDKAHKGPNVDEMLSDDYYKQEEDDQGDPFRQKLLNYTDVYGSKITFGVIAASANNFVPGKKSKASCGVEYEDDDAYFEDEEDDVDEDDPDDVDFDPDFGTTTTGIGNKINGAFTG